MAHPLDLPPLPHEMVLFAGDDAYWPVVLDPDFMWDFFQQQEVGDVNAFQQVPLDEEDFWGEDLEEEDGEDSDRDSGYESLSEDEEEDEEEVNVRDQWDPPAEAEEHAPQPPAEIPYPDFIPLHEDPNFIPLHEDLHFIPLPEVWDQWDPPAEAEAAAPQPTAEILYPDFIPLDAPSGSKHPRDEEEDKEQDDGPSSKRTRWSFTEDSPEDPSPSTSAGTSGGFTRYFHTFWDPDDD